MIDPQPKAGPITAALTAPRKPHRKRVQHWDRVNQGRMFTFSCYQRRPLLMDGRARVLLSRSIAAKLSQSPDRGWTLLGFVFMPEHVHLVMLPRSEDCGAAALLKAVKGPMSFQYKRLLEAEGSALLSDLTIRERPGRTVFRFWQEGPGHDANLDGDDGIRRALWYVHNNPVKRGLCANAEGWDWSSARQYFGLEPRSPWVPRVVRMMSCGMMWGDGSDPPEHLEPTGRAE